MVGSCEWQQCLLKIAEGAPLETLNAEYGYPNDVNSFLYAVFRQCSMIMHPSSESSIENQELAIRVITMLSPQGNTR